MESRLDKRLLLTYTSKGYDGFAHSLHSWFRTREDMQAFVDTERAKGHELEIDLAIEILEYRPVSLQSS